MKQGFTFLMRVRYCECDAQGVVFNSRYGDYADVAVTEYFRTLFGGGYEKLLERNLENQVIKMTTQWQSSAKFDEVLVVEVKTTKVGNTSFTIQFTFSEFETKRAVAETEIVYVMVTADTFDKTPVPDDIREALLNGTKGCVINQAGVVLSNDSK